MKFSSTALIVGTMVPDFEDFFLLRHAKLIGHHLNGILLFDLPVGLLSCYLFHNVLKHPLIFHLPHWYKIRLQGNSGFNWNKYAKHAKFSILMSLLFGIITHLAWDSITHPSELLNGKPATFLSMKLHFLNQEVPVYFILQILCSLFGVAWLQKIMIDMPTTTVRSTLHVNGLYKWTFLILAILIISARLMLWPEYNSPASIVKCGIGAIVYAWILSSLIFQTTNIQTRH